MKIFLFFQYLEVSASLALSECWILPTFQMTNRKIRIYVYMYMYLMYNGWDLDYMEWTYLNDLTTARMIRLSRMGLKGVTILL